MGKKIRRTSAHKDRVFHTNLSPEQFVVQNVIDDIEVGIVAVGLDRTMHYCNRAFAEFIGRDREQILGRTCCEIFAGSLGLQECLFEKTFATGRPFVNKLLHVQNADGEVDEVVMSTALVHDNDGETTGAVLTMRFFYNAGQVYDFPMHLWITAQRMQDSGQLQEHTKKKLNRHCFNGIISASSEMQELFTLLPRVAESESTILIEGPSGSGKELIAQTIHRLSHRKNRPLITVNSGAVPDTLLESELFGYKAGAFTDAKKDKPGRIAQAEGGTLFLDEIGDISPALQVKLLRFLQAREYEPLGSTQTQKANVRILAATHHSLDELVARKAFRHDLYFRLNVFKIVLPPLCRRREDIPLLADFFIQQFNMGKKRSIKGISSEALSVLLNYDFPGNIRELQNIIEHAYILCIGDYLRPEHFPANLQPDRSQRNKDVRATLETLEEITILDALKRHKGNRAAAARELGVHKTTLWRKIKLLGISSAE